MRAVHMALAMALVANATCTQADTMDLAGIGGRFALKVTSVKEARFKRTTRQQYDFSCGSAALATLLTHHYGYPVTEQAVFEEMFTKGDQGKIRREGFSLLDIKAFLEARQFKADGFELPLEKLAESGLPALVLIVEKGYHHFVVIKGLRDGRVLIGDPSSGTRAVSRAHFDSIWTNKVLFVVHNRQNQAKFNADNDWQAAPKAPLTAGINADSLAPLTLGKFGPTDF